MGYDWRCCKVTCSEYLAKHTLPNSPLIISRTGFVLLCFWEINSTYNNIEKEFVSWTRNKEKLIQLPSFHCGILSGSSVQFLTGDKCINYSHGVWLQNHKLDELARFHHFIVKHYSYLAIEFVCLRRYCKLKSIHLWQLE